VARRLASTQDHGTLAGRERIIRRIAVEELRAGAAVEEHEGERPSLYPE
jgi:hypothetical protein